MDLHLKRQQKIEIKHHRIKTGTSVLSAIYEDSDGYYTSKIAFSIENDEDKYKINSMVVTDKEPIFDFEVFDEISKPEFVSIYNINRVDEFLDTFYKDNPFTLKSDMENGVFFTRFKLSSETPSDCQLIA